MSPNGFGDGWRCGTLRIVSTAPVPFVPGWPVAFRGTVAVAEETAGPVFVAVRPESVALYLSAPHGSPRNVWPARLVSATPHGATPAVRRHRGDCSSARWGPRLRSCSAFSRWRCDR